jgi:hypothetical protein
MQARSGPLLWVGLLVAILLTVVFPLGGVLLSAIVAVAAHLRGHSLVRTLAILALLLGLVVVIFGPNGATVDGGLID